jgi:hypothetical protein
MQTMAATTPYMAEGSPYQVYSYILELARYMLCIVASSPPSERVFSCRGNIVTNKMCNFPPCMVNVLVTLKENIAMVDWAIDGDVKEEEEEVVEMESVVEKSSKTAGSCVTEN